jgi:uncharacterized membrane protein
MFPFRTVDATAVALLALSALAGLALWPSLPNEMAIHFGASGTPDNFVEKPLGVLLAPVIGVGALAFVRLASRVDPTADRRVLDVSVLFLGATIAFVQSFVLAWNLGVRLNPMVVVVPVLAGALLLTLYAVKRDGLLG